MHPKRLTEKGYGNEVFGDSTVIADLFGNPVPARPVDLPDGSIGAEIFLLNKKFLRDTAKQYIICNDVYQIIIRRRKGNSGTVKVLMWNLDFDFPQATELVCGFDIQNNVPRLLADASFGSIEAKELLSTTLSKAFVAAINRSYNPKPDCAFFAFFVPNAKKAKREVFEKKVSVTV